MWLPTARACVCMLRDLLTVLRKVGCGGRSCPCVPTPQLLVTGVLEPFSSHLEPFGFLDPFKSAQLQLRAAVHAPCHTAPNPHLCRLHRIHHVYCPYRLCRVYCIYRIHWPYHMYCLSTPPVPSELPLYCRCVSSRTAIRSRRGRGTQLSFLWCCLLARTLCTRTTPMG